MRFRPVICLLLVVFSVVGGALPAGANSYPVIPGPPFPVPTGYPLEGTTPIDAFYAKRSGIWVVGTGTVQRILRDDARRPRHQRFVIRTPTGLKMRILHNIDLAPRVPLRRGDAIAFRAEYEWNEDGGILRRTHRERRGRDGGGWIVWKDRGFR